MSQPLDERYFTWLYSQVGSVRIADPSRTHWEILKRLYNKEFVWIVPNDDNRAEDGRALRHEFVEEERIASPDPDWMRLGCSMLELLIGLARRLSFEDGISCESWFWEMMKNLQLDMYTDNLSVPEETVDEVLNCVIWRTYADDGTGGLFRVCRPSRPLPEMELWYQAQALLIERYY